MKCPVCHDGMIVLEFEQVEIDHCTSCRGIWLDEGELQLLLGDKSHSRKLILSFETCPGQSTQKRKCPICFKAMEQITCGPNSNITIDRCKNHHGLWFDLGELEEVISFFHGSEKVSNWLKELFSHK